MIEFNELLELLQQLEIEQTSIDWRVNIPEPIWNVHSKGRELASGLYVQKHRWYETSITVVEIYGKLLGIKHVSDLFSEESSVEDVCFTLEFFEMEEIMVTSYKRVK